MNGAAAWFALVAQRGYGHGSELVNVLGAAGQPDNVADAQQLLRQAVQRGELFRCRFDPTREQLFFDCNGSLKHSPQFHYECSHYSTT